MLNAMTYGNNKDFLKNCKVEIILEIKQYDFKSDLIPTISRVAKFTPFSKHLFRVCTLIISISFYLKCPCYRKKLLKSHFFALNPSTTKYYF